MGAFELSWREAQPRKCIDWMQPYAFIVGGYV